MKKKNGNGNGGTAQEKKSDETDLVRQPVSTALHQPQTQRALILKEALREETEQRKLLGEYVRSHMVAGSDYGVIPGTTKPTLLKPGAEKLIDLFRCTAQYEILGKEERWETKPPLFAYNIKAIISSRDAGTVVAEGIGSCNSMESKYRWRHGVAECPDCGKDLRISKNKPEWYCWSKMGGCGSTFPKAAIAGGRVENDDTASQANTVLKMAKKRALVDAAIALARCSDLFNQDLDDHAPEPEPMSTEETNRSDAGVIPVPSAPAPTPQAQPAPASTPNGDDATANAVSENGDDSKEAIKAWAAANGLTGAQWSIVLHKATSGGKAWSPEIAKLIKTDVVGRLKKTEVTQ